MALIPQYSKKNVLVGQAALYTAPYNEDSPVALPDESSHTLGDAWQDPWVAAGASSEGLTLTFSRDATDIMIEEQFTPVTLTTGSIEMNVNITLSEDTLETMKLAFGGGTITETTAGTDQIGKKELAIADALEHMALGFEGRNSAGYFRQVLIPDVVSVGEVETSYRRAESQRLYACSFRALVAPSEVTIKEKTAEATS